MFSSFTRDEKKLFIFLLSIITFGYAVRPFVSGQGAGQVFRSDNSAAASSPLSGMAGNTSETKQQTGAVVAAGAMPGVLPDGRVDINAACADVLMTLPGVGPSRAEAIVAYRQEHGGFRTVEELDLVKGFGPSLMAKVRTRVCVAAQAPPGVSATAGSHRGLSMVPRSDQPGTLGAPKPTRTPAIPAVAVQTCTATPAATTAAPSPGNSLTGPIDINTATAEQLTSLYRIGPKLAANIVADRQLRGPFRSVDELDRVRGIGPGIINANRNRMVAHQY